MKQRLRSSKARRKAETDEEEEKQKKFRIERQGKRNSVHCLRNRSSLRRGVRSTDLTIDFVRRRIFRLLDGWWKEVDSRGERGEGAGIRTT